jgi:hypothetical protein
MMMDRFERLRRMRVSAGLVTDPAAAGLHAQDHVWHGPHPINDVAGAEALGETVLRPMGAALERLEERLDILIAGSFDGGRLDLRLRPLLRPLDAGSVRDPCIEGAGLAALRKVRALGRRPHRGDVRAVRLCLE